MHSGCALTDIAEFTVGHMVRITMGWKGELATRHVTEGYEG